MRNIYYIVLHCTATQQTATVASIQRYWREEMGWKSPGYHRIIEPCGKIHVLAPDEKVTNGVGGYNSHSLHVSYIGGVDAEGKAIDNRTPAQKLAMAHIASEWKKRWPSAEVLGHRDFPGVKKACPSFDARKWFRSIFSQV